MRLLPLVALAPVALALGYRRDNNGNGYGNLPPCPLQTTTVTCTKTRTLEPASATVTVEGTCIEYSTTVTGTDTHTVHTESIQTDFTPPVTTVTAEPTSTVTSNVVGPVVTVCRKGSGDDDDQGENNNNQRRDWAHLTNAQRLQRGLPLRVPVRARDGDGGGKPEPNKPSCKPTTTTIRPTITVDYQVTNTGYVTTCRTEWVSIAAQETTTVTDVSHTTEVDPNLPYNTITVPAQYPATKTVTTFPTTTIKCRGGGGGGDDDDQGENNNNQRKRNAKFVGGYARKRAVEKNVGRA